MSTPRFPDPARSRALLIGTSRFAAAGSDLPDIPAVTANLTALRQVLTSPDTGVLRPDFCHVLADPVSTEKVGAALSDAAATATDLLLVYYAGHGLVDDRGRLHLGLTGTQPHRAPWTALPFELLREEFVTSRAATRVLVLDCCFSGRAIEAMADNQSVVAGQLDVAGTYTLTSTTANAPSHVSARELYTTFTAALLRALDQTDPLTLDQIYVMVDGDLTAQSLPRPPRRAVNTAGDLALSRGRTTISHSERLGSAPLRRAGKRVRRVFWFAVTTVLVLTTGAVSLYRTSEPDKIQDDSAGTTTPPVSQGIDPTPVRPKQPTAQQPPPMNPTPTNPATPNPAPADLAPQGPVVEPPTTASPRSATYVVDSAQWPPDALPGITVKKGQIVQIVPTSGNWICVSDTRRSGVEGIPLSEYPHNQDKYAVPHEPICSLIGKVGNGPWRELGHRQTFAAHDSGLLYLTVNELMPEKCDQPPDSRSCYTDNTGKIEMNIKIT